MTAPAQLHYHLPLPFGVLAELTLTGGFCGRA